MVQKPSQPALASLHPPDMESQQYLCSEWIGVQRTEAVVCTWADFCVCVDPAINADRWTTADGNALNP